MSYEKDGKTLYEVGDKIKFRFQTFPGPKDHEVDAEVIECLSPTYYEIRYQFQGKTETRRLIRSHLP